jgi:hypothetical protein
VVYQAFCCDRCSHTLVDGFDHLENPLPLADAGDDAITWANCRRGFGSGPIHLDVTASTQRRRCGPGGNDSDRP